MPQPATRVLLVGWDAADWKIIRPLLDRGHMPHLARLMDAGVHGNLATLYPTLSPMLWTSIATGKRAPKHGILGFTEITPDGGHVRAISNLGRKVKAIWNILHQRGKRSLVVGWWPSHPAEPIDGVMVSNHFAGIEPAPFPLPPLWKRTVHPPEWSERLAELRVHPMELEGEMLRLFVPDPERVNQDRDRSLHKLAALVAHAMSIHAAATELLAAERWDLAAIYFDSIDHFCHRFIHCHPPRLPWVPEEEFALYRDVVSNAYRYHDAMLGRLLELAGPETHVLVLSDHGFHADQHRRAVLPAEMAGPAVEHRHFGMFCLAGPGIRRGEAVYGASLLDITPTLLHLFGLPVGEDMDGKVLTSAFENPSGIDSIPSWDAVPGDAGCHVDGAGFDPVSAAEALKQLIDLGYVAPPAPDRQVTLDEHLFEMRYNLARAYLDERRPDLAEPVLAGLLDKQRGSARVAERLLRCLLARGGHAEARRMMDSLDAACEAAAVSARSELERRERERPREKLQQDLDARDQRELFERQMLGEQTAGYILPRLLMRMQLEVAASDRATAHAYLARLESQLPPQGVLGLAIQLAEAYLQIGDAAAALRWCAQALEEDAEDWHALGLKARIHFETQCWEAAFDAAVESLSLIHFQPQLHYIVGRCLMATGEPEEAAKALRTALTQMPGLPAAQAALAELCEGPLARPGGAAVLRASVRSCLEEGSSGRPPASPAARLAFAAKPADDGLFYRKWARPEERDIVVVSGLPRSGTSMMMQMLAAGGLELWTDGVRQPDEDNPHGYHEHGAARRLAEDASWLPQARGRAVKIVAPLLSRLPAGEQYRIILMRRDLAATIASQRVMLRRQGRAGADLAEDSLKETYLHWLREVSAWIRQRDDVAVLPCAYEEVLDSPLRMAEQIGDFLGRPFDCVKAAAAVEPRLKHHGSLIETQQ
jgi:predicted AlkP superfamily phosphohydrolase/phosphomutase/tetratricopeptide (TPR) repeat protein